MTDLTNADDFELVRTNDRAAGVELNRWTKKGDRLYLNEVSNLDGVYLDLETGELGGTSGRDKSEVTVEGDTVTITYEWAYVTLSNIEYWTHEIVVKLVTDEDEEDEEDSEPELVADGGEDVARHVEDSEIEAAIQQHDDPDHPDVNTVSDVRDALAAMQRDTELYWAEYMDAVEVGHAQLVAETHDVVVLSVSHGEDLYISMDEAGIEDDILRDVVVSVHHRVASRLADYDWSASDPMVIRKPDGVDEGQRYVEAVINNLVREGLSPGQAWHYYGVEVRGNSRNSWAKRCGYSDHSAVSESVRKAKRKLP